MENGKDLFQKKNLFEMKLFNKTFLLKIYEQGYFHSMAFRSYIVKYLNKG